MRLWPDLECAQVSSIPQDPPKPPKPTETGATAQTPSARPESAPQPIAPLHEPTHDPWDKSVISALPAPLTHVPPAAPQAPPHTPSGDTDGSDGSIFRFTDIYLRRGMAPGTLHTVRPRGCPRESRGTPRSHPPSQGHTRPPAPVHGGQGPQSPGGKALDHNTSQ